MVSQRTYSKWGFAFMDVSIFAGKNQSQTVRRFSLFFIFTSLSLFLWVLLEALGLTNGHILYIFERYISSDGVISLPYLLYFKLGFFLLTLAFGAWFISARHELAVEYFSRFSFGLFALYVAISILFFCERYQLVSFPVLLFDEDGFFENATAILLFIASILFILSTYAIFKVGGSRFYVLLYLLFAFMLFTSSMEEISWGQRIFGIETPEMLKTVNYQGELNIHNLFNPFFGYIYFGLGVVMSVGLIATIMFRKNFQEPAILALLPKRRYFYLSIFFFAIASYSELFEIIEALFLFNYSIDVRNNLKTHAPPATRSDL